MLTVIRIEHLLQVEKINIFRRLKRFDNVINEWDEKCIALMTAGAEEIRYFVFSD